MNAGLNQMSLCKGTKRGVQLALTMVLAALASDTQAQGTITTPTLEEMKLEVSTYATPTVDGKKLNLPTHIAFGPGGQEIITDLKNNRFVYRANPDTAWQASPLPVAGPHSVVYNPADSLYYVNDTENSRMIAFSNLASTKITAQTGSIQGVTLSRVHDAVIDPKTNWLYAINPNSRDVFRFSAIGQNETKLNLSTELGGYARSLTFADDRLFAIGSAMGRIVEIVDWDNKEVKVYQSPDEGKSNGSAGSWSTTGLVINDLDYYDGYWYATSYYTKSYAPPGTDTDENKLIRFETFEDFEAGDWQDVSALVPDGMVPYYLTVHDEDIYLAIFDHESLGSNDAILKISTVPEPSTGAMLGLGGLLIARKQ